MPEDAARLRCGAREVVARYLGHQQWHVIGEPEGVLSATNETVGAAIRDRLGLAGEVPFNTREIDVEAPGGVKASIRNNTFPTSLWFYDISGPHGGEAGATEPVDAAIWACLVGLALPATARAGNAAVTIDPGRFSASALAELTDASSWAHALSIELSAALSSAKEPVGAYARELIEHLRGMGHDLYSFDESLDFAIWRSEASPGSAGHLLVVEAFYAPYEKPNVVVTVRQGEVD